jgi:hypothetical protein
MTTPLSFLPTLTNKQIRSIQSHLQPKLPNTQQYVPLLLIPFLPYSSTNTPQTTTTPYISPSHLHPQHSHSQDLARTTAKMQFTAIFAATLALFAGAALAKDKTSVSTQTIYKTPASTQTIYKTPVSTQTIYKIPRAEPTAQPFAT